MPNYVYPAIGLIGGTAGFLDAIDGTALADKDMAMVSVQGDKTYFYVLDVDSAAAEASPGIIAPDANGGDKRWLLTGFTPVPAATGFTIAGGTTSKTLTVEDTTLVNQDLTTDADPTFDTLNLTSGQLIFPATQVPSAGANTLDDYEEGTFNVTFACGTSGTITIASNVDTMSYTKIGRVVIITGYITVASVNSPVGSLLINGLPFTSQAGTENSGWGAVSILANNLQATGITSMVGYIASSSNSITIFHFADGVIGDAAADVKAGSDFIITATYFV